MFSSDSRVHKLLVVQRSGDGCNTPSAYPEAMSAPSLRVVRRAKGARRSLVAASAPVTDPRQVFRSTLGTAARDDWQSDAWDMLDAVGELRYYVSWRANSCSRVRLVASDIDPDTGLPTGATEDRRFIDIVKAVAGGPLGAAQLVKRAVECLTVPGEVWIAVIVTDQGERWLALSKDEIRRTRNDLVELQLPEGSPQNPIFHVYNNAVDSLVRVWNPRPRSAQEADSPVRATLDSLREIVRTTATIANASKSRLIGPGLVLLPQEMNLPPTNVPATAGQTGAQTPVWDGTPAVQQLQEMLWQIADTAYDDPDSMAALIPIMLTAPGDLLDKVTRVTFDNTITDVNVKVRNDAISRLAMGLDVSPERLLGVGNTTNHWSAWAIGDEDVQLHIVPPMETICQALYQHIITPILVREGMDPQRFMLWYDTGDLTADPDKTDNATAAFTAGTITSEAYVELLGLDVDHLHDFTTADGWREWAQTTVSAHPELMTTLAPLLIGGPIDDLIPELMAVSAPAPSDGAVPPDQGAPAAEPQTENTPPNDQLPAAARQRNGVHLAERLTRPRTTR